MRRACRDPENVTRPKIVGVRADDLSAAPFARRCLAIALYLAAHKHRGVASLDHELVIELRVHLDQPIGGAARG